MSPSNVPCSQSPQSVLDYSTTHSVLQLNPRYPEARPTLSYSSTHIVLPPTHSVLPPNPQCPTAQPTLSYHRTHYSFLQTKQTVYCSLTKSVLEPTLRSVLEPIRTVLHPKPSVLQPNDIQTNDIQTTIHIYQHYPSYSSPLYQQVI